MNFVPKPLEPEDEDPAFKYGEYISKQLRSISDISITMRSKIMGADLKYSIIVNKYNGALFPFAKMVGFRVEPRIGFVVEISSVA